MADIIERLRIESQREPNKPIWRDAIDEIEALRAEVEAAKLMTETVHESLRIAVANELAAEERAERLAEALRVAREYVVSELAAERDKFAGYEHCSNIASIEADLAKIDAAVAKESSND